MPQLLFKKNKLAFDVTWVRSTGWVFSEETHVQILWWKCSLHQKKQCYLIHVSWWILLQLVENGMNVKEIWTHYKVVSAFRLTCKGSRLASAMLLKPGDTCPQISPA